MDEQSIRLRTEAATNSLEVLCVLWPTIEEQYKAGNLLAEDQLGRFRIWAKHIGVFAKGHASLDYRLRDSAEVRLLMIDQLGTLQSSVQKGEKTISQIDKMKVDNHEAIELSHSDSSRNDEVQNMIGLASKVDASSEAANSAVLSSFCGTETDSLAELLDLSPFQQRIYAVEQTIDRLFRLSRAIRRHSLENQDQRVAKFVITDDEGNANTDAFERYALTRIHHQFPNAPSEIAQKLAGAITFRRRRFLYRSSHQSKLSSYAVQSRKSSTNLTMPSTQEHSTIVGQRSQVTLSPAQKHSKKGDGKHPKTRALSTTTASFFAESNFRTGSVLDARSTIITSLATGPDSLISAPIPNAPPLPAGSKEFECPYCCIMLSIEEASGINWRRHVMNDLEPYVCLSQGCENSQLLFRDRTKWLEHIKKAHTLEWSCKAKGHPLFSTSSEQDFENHMRALHSESFTEKQLPLLKKRSQRSASAIFSHCPLCAYIPSRTELDREAALSGSSSAQDSSQLWLLSEIVAKHLAVHLEYVATFALPWHDNVKDDPSEKTSSGRVEDGTRNNDAENEKGSSLIEGSAVVFNDDCESTMSSVEEAWLMQVRNHIEVEDGCEPTDDEWSFIDIPEYFGHARDPTLQTFLKDLYLSSTSATSNASGPHFPCHLVPINPSKDFFGREYVLKAISASLCPNDDQQTQTDRAISFPRSFAVYAPGGMGKTQVAAKFVTQHQHEFDAIFWVHADNTTKISQDFKYIAKKLGLVSEDSVDARDFEYTLHAVRRWLIRPIKNLTEVDANNAELAQWLLVLDGVEDPSILNSIWPYNGPGSILITSRNPFSWTQSVQLMPFSSEQAVSFLLHMTERKPTEQERKAVVDISEQLGGLPLALTQMAGIMIHKKMSFGGLLNSWSERHSKFKLLQESEGSLALKSTGYERTIASVWAFENLTHGRKLLDIISMLDPDGIPESILNIEIDASNISRSLPMWKDYASARDELVACSIISRDKARRRLFTHRLVQTVARARMTPFELRSNFMACVRLLCAVWPFEKFSWRHNVTRWSLCEKLFPQVFRLRDLWNEIPESDKLLHDEFRLAELLTAAGCAETVLTKKQLDAVTAEIQHNRGCIATEINIPHDALIYQQIFNSMMAEELGCVEGGQDMRLAISWNELGNAWMLNRHWKRAEECFEKSIRFMRLLDSYEKIWISLPLVNLGLAFWLQGCYDTATEKLLEGFHDRQEHFGNDDHESFITGRFLHALGNVKASQGLLDEAQNFHHKALLHNKLTLGNNHHRTADTLVKVTDHHLRLGQHEIALALLDHALKIYESTNNHETFAPEKARALFKRQQALRELDKPKDADILLRDCYKLYSQLFDQNLSLNPLSPQTGTQSLTSGCRNQTGPLETTLNGKEKKMESKDLRDEDLDDLITFWSK
ncbi:hypothetical protein ACLMJK_006486 [Lecanora helva]